MLLLPICSRHGPSLERVSRLVLGTWYDDLSSRTSPEFAFDLLEQEQSCQATKQPAHVLRLTVIVSRRSNLAGYLALTGALAFDLAAEAHLVLPTQPRHDQLQERRVRFEERLEPIDVADRSG